MDKKIRVLHLISGLGYGGAERFIHDLSFEFKSTKYIDNHIVAISKQDQMLKIFEQNGINVKVLYKDKRLVDIVSAVMELKEYIDKYHINIIHAHMTHALIVASCIKVLNDIPIVFTPHSYRIGGLRRNLLVWLLKPFRKLDILFADDMKRYFHKSSYKVVANGIDMKRFEMVSVPKYDKFTFVAIGNLKKAKNYQLLLKSVYQLKEKFDFQVLIIGDGEQKEELEEYVMKYKLSEYVKFEGTQSDVSRYLASSHALVLSSLWEGMPISILEAGAMCIPVISTNVGSISSILDTNTGYLVDNPDSFARYMQHLYLNYDEAKTKAKNLYKTIKYHYNISNISSIYKEIYQKLLK